MSISLIQFYSTMKSDLELQKDVLDELKWDPSLIDTKIIVNVNKSIVTLSGIVDSSFKKKSAAYVAKQVTGVKAVVSKIKVKTGESIDFTRSTFADAENILSTTDDNLLKISGA